MSNQRGFGNNRRGFGNHPPDYRRDNPPRGPRYAYEEDSRDRFDFNPTEPRFRGHDTYYPNAD